MSYIIIALIQYLELVFVVQTKESLYYENGPFIRSTYNPCVNSRWHQLEAPDHTARIKLQNFDGVEPLDKKMGCVIIWYYNDDDDMV